ncbi:hypothetical protein CC85DRAFT_299827 [Cutaneotrichosporon oleaginosum]|uniref:N-glycosylation protein EOS1 n=1 Tax=Cutaneotrichosporon oleaginosum TaxID=879819 RepID=A0A0J0XWB4_9TREE|nr:uncharacterized protein CC85DRAFT_299827 [Cutaneotrichosporon oleaginosum]KLT45371.1 hypothetical protein CC85DRAFT_299827 [Cutaneotrichosporon oleaginosum]TXT14805.1 hypothetical protein COLE_00998 [Cutaneotrichosporon oleaginosum]
MSRPARDMAHGLAPMSTITPIDLNNAAANGANGYARLNGHANHPGYSPAAGQHLSLQPPAHIETRSPSHSPRTLHPRLSPEAVLKPLSQLAPINPNAHALANPRQKAAQRGATIPPVQQQRPALSYYNLPDPGPSSAASSGSSRTVRAGARRRAGSNPRPPSSTSSEDTETEVDSDSTFVPGRVRHQHSKSQPDLTALRSRLAESWANQQQEERRLREEAQANSMLSRRRSHGRKTPPIRPMPLASGAHPHIHPHRQSSAGFASAIPQSALGLRHSPRTSTVALAHLTPITSSPRAESSAEDSPWSLRGTTIPHGGMTGSEDADDDLESTDSPSSGSLSFSPKLRRRQRQSNKRDGSGSGSGSGGAGPVLGLLLEPNSADERSSQGLVDLRPESIEARLRRSSLLNFRLLAVVPALWGISVLTHALVTGALWHDVWPWGVDLSRESVERLVQGLHVYEGIERPVHRGDMALAIAWAIVTAHFCFCLTTGLTHRWRSYYSLPSTVTRLVSLQCLCWPATYTTLWVLGPTRPLLAWVVIGVTTGWSRTVQMWVTSNVTVDDDGGDVTPGPRRSPPLRPPPPPSHVTGWRKFTYGRRWDWDAVAREVGWKVGGLLLVTCAWLFWRLDEMSYGKV